MNGVVPLYYNMRKAEPTLLNNKTIYAGLNAAFTGGNIGVYSNNISKIWNNDVFVNGTTEEQQEAIDVVKLLCMENNFAIDQAKTLYMPERVEWFKPVVSKYTNVDLPAFFEYAKDKTKSQVVARNQSFVNRIFDKIPNTPINTRNLDLGKIDYALLMSNPATACSREVTDLYDSLNRQYRYMINMKDEYADNLRYVACRIRAEFSETGYSDETITDMLVKYLYGGEKRFKQILWFCYGQNIVNNLKTNIGERRTKLVQCVDCDEWIEVDVLNTKTCRCDKCNDEYKKSYHKAYMRKKRNC